MIPYRFLPEAERELDEIVDYYERERPGLGGEFLDALGHTIERACRFPQAGTRLEGLSRSVEVRRYFLNRFPYKLIGVVRSDGLVFVAAPRQRQHPDAWKPRLAKVRP